MARLSETLRQCQYPSLQLEARTFTGEHHYTVVPRTLCDPPALLANAVVPGV
jgi:hypothetical protein